MMAPKLPATEIQPPERQTEDVEQYKRITEKLSASLLQMTTQRPYPAPAAPTSRESGENMEYFWGLTEGRFRSMSLSQDLWGHELGDHLDGIALRCYSDLVRTGADMTDRSYVKRELLKGFCSVDRATAVRQMADNKWTGDCRTYTANFYRITANGAQLPADELVSYFFTNIPDELRWAAAKRGPWGTAQEEFPRRQQEFRLSRAGGDAENPLATGPNTIPVSPRWAKKLYPKKQGAPEDEQKTMDCRQLSARRRTEAQAPSGNEEEARDADSSAEVHDEVSPEDSRSNTHVELPLWWRELVASDGSDRARMLCGVGTPALLPVEVVGRSCEALLDTGASRSFINPSLVEALQLKVKKIPDACMFTVANGAQSRIDRVVKNLTAWCGRECFTGDYLVSSVPCEIVLGFDWLTKHRVAWHFQSDKLRTYLNGQWRELPLVRSRRDDRIANGHQVPPKRTPAEEAYDLLARQVAEVSETEIAALLRPPPKRTKPRAEPGKEMTIKDLIEQARANASGLQTPLEGLNLVLALPEVDNSVAQRLSKIHQGALCCAIFSPDNPRAEEAHPSLSVDTTPGSDDEVSSWHTTKLDFTLFDTWMQSPVSQDLPQEIREMLQTHGQVFPDNLPPGLPPKRPHDHHILLAPGRLPAKSAIYRMTPEQLQFHKQEISKLSAHGWIGPTYSPICVPTITADKRDDGTGDRKMRMAVNYQALNALTVAPDLLLPPIQTILKMLGGAKYFSTLDLKAGFHQIRMAKKDRWKTAFRSVLGLADGIKPAAGKIEAIRAWPEVLENGTQELLALVTALDKWSHLLRVGTVTAFTDHQALTHPQKLQTSNPLRGSTTRWIDFLAEFPDLTITYLQGARNTVADALSRLPCHSSSPPPPPSSPPPLPPSEPLAPLVLTSAHPAAAHRTRGNQVNYWQLEGISRRRPQPRPQPPPITPKAVEPTPGGPAPPIPSPVQPTRSETLDWPPAYFKCPVFRDPYNTAVQANGASVQVESRNRLLTFRFVTPFLSVCIYGLWGVCVPQFPEFVTHILYNHHGHITAGRRGQKKTYLSVSKHYYWPGMRTYTNAYVESCTQCRASKSLNQNPAGLLQQLLIPPRRWSHVSVDFITDLPPTKSGHDSILVLVDFLSKMSHFVPVKKRFTAADTVDILADRLIRYHGLPEALISDRDPRFQSALWQQLRERFHIKRPMPSSYHPQSDGQTERVNRTLEQMLRTCIQADEREWERLLPALELAYNTTSHSSTERSTFEIMIGENPLTSADLDVVGSLSPTLTPPMTNFFLQLCDRAQSHILKAKSQQKRYADTHRRQVEFAVGDKLVPDRPRAPALEPREAVVGWQPTRDSAGNPTDQYEVDYILDQRRWQGPLSG
ncbi:hypothetical protein EBH_0039570 [Eimeria brunetti]|uniref:RNA-directed DNA polymerase n=1 Tax=Eimeria brunetti TaxID=51314 RepID=U6LIS9_9EIME|nr:hypothetical protein EBH_0039570 [Eimeria brunetti]